MSNRAAIITLFVLITNVVTTYVFDLHFTKAPLNADISLSSTEQETFNIFIPMQQKYDVKILFAREDKDFEYLQNTIGPMTHPEYKGFPLLLEWEIIKDNIEIKTNKTSSNDSCGWSNTHVYRCYGDFILPRGNYQFNIRVLNVDTELTKFKTKLTINYNFKNAHTWQTAYIFWGSVFNLFIAPILGGVILLILLVRLYKHLTSSSSGRKKHAA
ncbi:MAG: hypothetical protein KAS57_03060 [Gammaproteobacteria bacterium]|nr:hypothetical protein [Gammaproteobacteria bacterium]